MKKLQEICRKSPDFQSLLSYALFTSFSIRNNYRKRKYIYDKYGKRKHIFIEQEEWQRKKNDFYSRYLAM